MKGKIFPNIDFNKFTLPPVELNIARRNGVFMVYDCLRKKFLILTEEEFVRQSFVNWMIKHLGYPPSIMANEIGINLNDTYKRCDTIVFSSDGSPIIILEFKAPSINIDQNVFNQILRYNMALKAKFLVVSNGYQNYFCKVNYEDLSVEFLNEMPNYRDIKLLKNG